jgi:hypothetical protein
MKRRAPLSLRFLSCGEEIVVPVDLAAGSEHVEVNEDEKVRVWAVKTSSSSIRCRRRASGP